MKIKTICLLLFFITGMAAAQQVEIFGYYEPQILAVNIKDDFFQLSSNKLRVDLKLDVNDNVSFAANFDYITYHGKTTWAILDYLPDGVAAEAPAFDILGVPLDPYRFSYSDRNFLDNAYARLSFSVFDLTLGKQQISMGTGYVWNPTDVFNQKDFVDPTYEQPGHNAVRLDAQLSDDIRFTTLFAPGEKGDRSDLMAQIKSRLWRFDFSFTAILKEWKYTDFRLLDLVSQNFFGVDVERRILGTDFAGEVAGFGLWSELAYNDVDIPAAEIDAYNERFASLPGNYQPLTIKESYYEWVIGGDYTFDFQTYIMFEYYRNTRAGTDNANYGLNDWLQFFFAETKAITRDQLYFFARHPLSDLLDIGTSVIVSLNDQSVAFVPTLTYSMFENVDVSLFTNIYTGKEGTAYARQQGSGGILRARIYF